MIYRWLTEVVKKVLGKEVSLKPVFGGTFCTFSCEDQTVDVTFMKIVINTITKTHCCKHYICHSLKYKKIE